MLDFEQTANELSKLGDDAIGRIAKLVKMQLALEARLAQLEEEQKDVARQLREIAEEELPSAMEEHGVSQLKMGDGSEITVSTFYSASIPKDETEKAFDWLRDNRFGDLIKNVVSTTFGRNDDVKAKALVNTLSDSGYSVNQKQWVEPMTLKAFVKEQVEKGAPLPMDLFGVYIGKKAKVRRK